VNRCAWDSVIGQEQAVSYLRTAVVRRETSHAYLFVGPPGAGKKTAARAFACAMLCDDDGCGACGTCYRVRMGYHPDVRIVEPEGVNGFLMDEQMRPLIRDINLTPAESSHKVYIIDQADLLGSGSENAANAFLKTLEEPPAYATIVLLAPSYDSVLPTIASRCHIVRFRRIAPSHAEKLVVQRTGARSEDARAALAATGGVLARAVEFLGSASRRDTRGRMLSILKDLPVMDGHDVLVSARELLASVRAPLEELKGAQAEEVEVAADFLRGGSGTALQTRHKRELTSREREAVLEVLGIAESWLRDCLAVSQGVDEAVANADARDAMEEVGTVITPRAALVALKAVSDARRRISYNVNPQLAVEAMLFDIQEVLTCPR